MPRKIRELSADLREAGCTWRPGKGDHRVWEHPDVPEAKLSLDGRDGDDAKVYQERAVRQMLALIRRAKERKP